MCATPRSGSTLLCEALASTGVAGRPREEFEQLAHSGLRRKPREYFLGLADPSIGDLLPEEPAELGDRLPKRPYADHVAAAIERGTTPNGVFATKLMWGYLADFLARVDGDLDDVFGNPSYVLVRRRDKLRQAISLWRALQTQSWRDVGGEDAGKHEPAFSATAIAHLRDQLESDEAAWNEYVATRGIEPLTLVYEEYEHDLDGAVRAVLEHIGVQAPPDLVVDVPMRRQSDALTDAWLERYALEAV